MSVSVDDIKQMMAVDGDDDNALIEGYLAAAKAYVKNAVGEDKSGKFYDQDDVAALYDVAVMALAGSYYQYRVSLADAQNYSVDLTLNSIIGQLRGLYATFESEAKNG